MEHGHNVDQVSMENLFNADCSKGFFYLFHSLMESDNISRLAFQNTIFLENSIGDHDVFTVKLRKRKA